MLLGAVNRDRVGYVHAQPDGYTFREPVRGRGAIMHAAATLLGRPAPDLATASAQETDTTIPWRLLARSAPKHSVLIWLSDFPPATSPDGWSLMRRRYNTMGFRVDDPWERELPAGESFTAYDPVAGRLVTLGGSSSERAAHARWREERDQIWHSLFPDPLSRLAVTPADNRLDALVRFFHARMHRGSR